MKNKKVIFSVLFAGILVMNTFFLSSLNDNDLQLNSLFTLASAQAEDGEEDGESGSIIHQICTSKTACGDRDGLPLKTRKSTEYGDRCCQETDPLTRGCEEL